MSIRHAAALSLMTRLLMVPPVIPNTPREANKSAPLSQWTIRRTFPRNEGCEAAKDRLLKQGMAAQAQRDATGRRGLRNTEASCILCQAQCVSEDDPRLKSN